MNTKIIGIGAAGNKAAIKSVQEDIVPENSILLMNTANQDIPVNFKGRSLMFGPTAGGGGCGKERERSQAFIADFMESNDGLQKALNQLISPGDLVVIVSSTEGGTGSGASPIIASYVSEVIGVRPHLIAFTGTEDDLRGLQNTLNFFKDCAEMCADCTVEAISNKKFMSAANNNKLKAEELANDAFIKSLKVLQGNMLKESYQNIDPMDHLKLVTTNGYMSILYTQTHEAIETVEQFNDLCDKMIKKSKALPTGSNRCVRMGVILTINEDDKDAIDWSFNTIKSQFAEVGEVFTHVQNSVNETRQIIVIECGLEMPLKFVAATYEQLKSRMAKSAKQTDFAATMKSIDASSDMFNFDNAMSKTTTTSSNDFLKKLKKNTGNTGIGATTGGGAVDATAPKKKSDDLKNY